MTFLLFPVLSELFFCDLVWQSLLPIFGFNSAWNSMDGWMDGWMEMDGWMDGYKWMRTTVKTVKYNLQ